MATTTSRRFSTMDLSAPTYQKDMTNDVRLKLAKVRARSRSLCAPSAPPPAPHAAELKTKKSSQLPRSSVTALTTSAKAKLRTPPSNGRNNNNTTVSSITSSSTNAPEPNSNSKRHHHHHSACNNKHPPHTTATATTPALTSQRTHQRSKSTRSTTKKTYDSNNNINIHYNDEDDMMIKFFESDSDEDDLFLRNTKSVVATDNNQAQRRQRRTTMPPRLSVSTRRLSTSYSPERSPSPTVEIKDDNADKNHDQSMWAELQELKSRLAKLEVQAPPTTTIDNTKKSSICSPPATRPSSIASVLLSPHSSLVDSACSLSNNTESAYQSQKVLQNSVLHLEQHIRQDENPNNSDNNSSFMNTLVDLVAETIRINQTLVSLGSQQQQQQQQQHLNSSLSGLQKSSERQMNLLADALQLFDIHRQQQPILDHPASPPLSQSAIDHTIGNTSPKPQKSLRTSMPAHSSPAIQHLQQPQQRQPAKSRAYSSYYDETMTSSSQNYADDASSQHSNLLTSSFNAKLQQRQQQHRRSIASAATAPVSLPHYAKYIDQEITPTRQYYQQQRPSVSSRPVSGILHHGLPSYQPQQQQPRYYSSTVEQQRQPSKQPSSQSAFQPMTPSVNRLLSMYETALKPTLMTNATSLPPLSPPQHYPSHQPYIDYETQA
ncbi:hypothetical protein [Absidia glauca]|uniref:Uncharacterized protein n=1 Tax=Absidia glauca TaxID=4829 RepID=A0A168SLD1_ABSGL|nr:hypothetical protein [Absidia glauca]